MPQPYYSSRPIGRKVKVIRKTLSQKKQWKYWLKLAIKVGVFFSILFFIYVFAITRNLPNPNQLLNREVAESTKIYDRTGENIIYEIHGDTKRTLVKLEDVPDNIKNATIAIEDKNFYQHGGVSIWAIARTMITNVIYNHRAGGSTLTQQFVKNAILSTEKKYSRKIKEVVLATRIEKKFSKDEILQMYLNEIPYGSTAYGIEAASEKYFGKTISEMDLAEAAILAAMIQAPSRYSPYGANVELLLQRQKYVLQLMNEQSYITEEEMKIAQDKELKFAPPDAAMLAPHFIMYVKQILSDKYGDKSVEQDGLKIITTLDIDKQKIAEEVIKTRTENYLEKYNASNAALVSIDPNTGQVLAMVGSKDFFSKDIDGQVNITTSLRQPGSSIKPIIYAAFFMKGYTPNTILYDVITNFSDGEPYIPLDYDGKERGPVSIRKALAGSLNIPAVKAMYLVGIKDVIKLANEMGYTSLTDPSRYGLSLVLGGGEIKMIEHVNAYSTFANEGDIHQISAILKVEDKDGKVLEEFKDKKNSVFPSQIAKLINSVLSDNSARAYVFGEKNYLTLGDRPVAAKTGTTNDFKDAWTVGYTPSLVTGVWVGNNSGKEMSSGADGSVVAAPIWNDYMKQATASYPVESFSAPDDYYTGKAVIDGKLAFGEHHSILYYVNPSNPLGPIPSDSNRDQQFNSWENPIKIWAEKNGFIDNNGNNLKFLDFTITKAEIINKNLSAKINFVDQLENITVEYFINNQSIYRTDLAPYNLNQTIEIPSGTLKVKVCDEYSRCLEKVQEIN